MAAATGSGTSGRATRTDGASCVSRWATIVRAFGPVKGTVPASVSYATVPSEYTSLRASSSSSPPDCSGLM